ncbi:MAG: hypothetical protein J6D16_00455 [Clostridia bacterium]|nr:hypothetical protein [Clostridia bacterium]
MKQTVKIIALFLSAWVLVSALSACSFEIPAITVGEVSQESEPETDPKTFEGAGEQTTVPETQAQPEETADESDGFEIVYPTVTVSTMALLPIEDIQDAFGEKLTAVKRIFGRGAANDAEEFKAAIYELLSLEAQLQTQCDVAYMLYLCDMTDAAWEAYLQAYTVRERVKDRFWSFYAEARGQSHVLAEVFHEIVQVEYEGRLVSKNAEVDDFAREMTALEGEFNAIKDSDASDRVVFEVYQKYMTAAYGLAVNSKVENYYEYAAGHTFYRNDTTAQREALREYTKKYLIPLCRALKSKSQLADSRLWTYEFELSNRFLENAYDSFSKNFLFDYFASLPKSSGDAMRDAFERDRVLVGDRDSSYNSAMVMDVGNTPICYFHKSELTLHTVAHEIGHYYAHIMGQKNYYSYDLRETYSTANTMLLYSYISNDLNSNAFISAELYMLYNWMYQVVLSVIKDEFDEQIFSCDPSALTLADFERIMSGLIDKYGVGDLSTNIRSQLMTYWRRLGIVYPMSNYCYATSMITAFQIYIKSKDDYAAACEVYRRVVEQPRESGDFVATIVNAGLTTPYDEATYTELQRLIETE